MRMGAIKFKTMTVKEMERYNVTPVDDHFVPVPMIAHTDNGITLTYGVQVDNNANGRNAIMHAYNVNDRGVKVKNQTLSAMVFNGALPVFTSERPTLRELRERHRFE